MYPAPSAATCNRPAALELTTRYGVEQLVFHAQSLNDWPFEARADGVASRLPELVTMRILFGFPFAIVWLVPLVTYVDVGPNFVVLSPGSFVCVPPTVGASRIHSALERLEL